jgi:acyl-CoA synthetase (AMP-forming)/AMP-acid ligase II
MIGNLVYNIALYAGSKHVFMMGFDLVRFLELVPKHKISKAFVVPPIILALAKHPIVDNYDLTSLKCMLSGAAPLGAEVQSLCQDRLKIMIKQGWGMTELSPLGCGVPDEYIVEHEWVRKAIKQGTAGLCTANSEVKIVDVNTGEDLEHTITGEICIKGPMVMNGYYENEAATKAMIDEGGWLHTGDVGHISEEGFIFITDRCKELIKYKGFQVAPAELEAVIAAMPSVKDCVVIPVPCPEAGELPRAYIVKQDDAESQKLSAKDVEEYVKANVAPHKRLRGGVRFQETVPKSPSGKILRRVQVEIDRKLSSSG